MTSKRQLAKERKELIKLGHIKPHFCDEITKSGKKCTREAKYFKRGKHYCRQHYRLHQDKAWGFKLK